MKICVICGECLQEDYDICPVCGCPKDRYTIEGLGFPNNLERQYMLAGIKEGSGGQRYLLLMSKNTGKKILAGKIPEEEKELCDLLVNQRKCGDGYFPMVYEIANQSEEVIFLFEDIPGETQKELYEKEYPPVGQSVFGTDRALEIIRKKLTELGGETIRPDPGSIIWNGEEFRMRDFGCLSLEDGFAGETTERSVAVNKNRLFCMRRVQLTVIVILSVILMAELYILFRMCT